MTGFQLLLFIIAGVIFYLFFKQLFSGNHPKRGIDFEAKLPDEQIGGISNPEKVFAKPQVLPTRTEELEKMADEAMQKNNFEEANKALGALLIIDENHIDALHKIAYIKLQEKAYTEAKEYAEKILSLAEDDDMAHVLMANSLHHLKEDEAALVHHQKAIALDNSYAAHHFNYANTLYDMGRKEEALEAYTQAYHLDNSLEVAKEMIDTLKEPHA